jgi:DNA-binding NtrC family response regulator
VLSGLTRVVATALHASLTPWWGSGYSVLSYCPAILFSVWIGGWRLDATARVVKDRPGTLVIGLSVNNSAQTREAMLAAGAVGFVTKEPAADQLYEAVVHAARHGGV